MNYETMKYQASRRERALKPVFGAVAVMAALATLGLAIVGPATLARDATPVVTVNVQRVDPQPIEVAITPATIQVVGKRVKTAQSDSGFVPAAYRP